MKVAELSAVLTGSATDLRPRGVDTFSGYGLVNVESALKSLDGLRR